MSDSAPADEPTPIKKLPKGFNTPEWKANAAAGRRAAAARRQALKAATEASVETEIAKARAYAAEWLGRDIDELNLADAAEAGLFRLMVELINGDIVVTTPTQANQLMSTYHAILRLEKGQVTSIPGGNREQILADIKAILDKKRPKSDTPEPE